MKYTHKFNLLFAVLIFYLLTAFDGRSQSVEYAIKSAMIMKIAQNIEWENLDSQKQFTIAVVGKSQFGDELRKATERLTIHNLPVRIEYAKELKMQSTPQLIFICKSEKKLLNDHIALVKNERNILIMADSPEFSGKGVHINLKNLI